MSKKSKTYKNLLISYIILSIILSFLVYENAFSNIRPVLTDHISGGKKALDNIVIVSIDDESIQKIGRWPWNRDVMANIINKVGDAKAIGVDISFFENSNNDSLIKSSIESKENVVLASEIINSKLYSPIFRSKTGYVEVETDRDGVTRSVNVRNLSILPFSFEIYKSFWNKQSDFSQEKYNINFAGPPNTFKRVSAYQVLNSNISFNNKIVLIGATAADLHDTFFVPTSSGTAMPGVEIHANILQNLILNNFITKQSNLGIIITTLILGLLAIFLISRLKVGYLIPTIILSIALYAILAIVLFKKTNYLLDLFFPILGILLYTATGTSVRYIEELKQSSYIQNAFGKYVSKEIVAQIVANPEKLKLGGAKREISIFFSDIRGFTTLSESTTPEKLVSLLNSYLTEMTSIILKNKGTVDKFIGDAIMAFWNAPLDQKDHADQACKAALEQIAALKTLQNKWKKKNLPVISIGCGIHTGDAVIGNMGSEDRFSYTAIGDSVNLASRLESLTKFYGVSIIVSESVYKKVKDKFSFRKLDIVKVKGKKLPIEIYELSDSMNNKLKTKYEEAFTLYSKRKFSQALKLFKECVKISKDKSSQVFIERCLEYIKSPPKSNWDGSYEMKSK